jgi:hypothetical protein
MTILLTRSLRATSLGTIDNFIAEYDNAMKTLPNP